MEWKYTDKLPNKYYDSKWKKGAYWVPSGYKYWQYRPWMIKDNGKPLKKNGRKKWTTIKSHSEMWTDIWRIVNLMTFWVKELKSEKNIKAWVNTWVALTVDQACSEMWITPSTLYYYLNKHPDLREQYNEMKENRRSYLKEVSENNIKRALTGKMKTLKENEIVDYSFKMLERTDQAYNPKQVTEVTVEDINPNRSTDDIINDIADLLR